MDWPMVSKDGTPKMIQYEFDGERSSGVLWHQLPRLTKQEIEKLLGLG